LVNSALYFVDAPNEDLDEILEELERLGREAITSSSGGIERVLDGYEAALDRYASVWTKIVPRLESSHLGDLIRDTGPVAEIHDALRKLITSVTSNSNIEDVYTLSYFPVRIAQRAIRWNAPAYLQLLDLYPSMYRQSRSIAGGPSVALRDRSWRHPIEALWLQFPSLNRPTSVPVDVEMIELAKVQVRSALQSVIDAALSAGDTAFATDVIKRWKRAERED
jgi:hypothetical protein